MTGTIFFNNIARGTMILKLKDLINSDTALTPGTGAIVYSEIDNALLADADIKIDFQGIKVMSSAFLNVAIGQLYSKFGSNQLNNHLKIINLAAEDRALLKKVITRAKDYFQDQKTFDDRINDLYGDE